jgi:acyl-CoA thioesterase-1
MHKRRPFEYVDEVSEIVVFVMFWASTTMYRDPLCFVDRGSGDATATLLFPIMNLGELSSMSGDVEYEEGRDFGLAADRRLLIRTAGSRIPETKHDELYPSADPDGSAFMFKRDAPGTYLMFGEGDLFHCRQVCATYTHQPGLWTAPVPVFCGDQMPRTMRRLRRRDRLVIAVTGDSISEGYNASGFVGVPPHQPPYVNLVSSGLTAVYGSTISLHNLASAGWTADQGLADASRLGALNPDVVIIAFGMNDSGYATPEDFSANIAGIISQVRQDARHAEFVLVSPMLPNPEWHYPVLERFAGYRDALSGLCAEGVVLADVTTLWQALLERKSVYDLTGNGINHPNDFGHRVYADTILSLLVDVENATAAPTYT